MIEQLISGSIKRFHLNHNFDFLEDGKVHFSYSHTIVIGVILLIMAVSILVFIPCRLRYGNLLLFAVITYILYLPIQYYITPMFSNIPGLFRYTWFYLVPMWCVVFCGLVMLLLNINNKLKTDWCRTLTDGVFNILYFLICSVILLCFYIIFLPLFTSPNIQYEEWNSIKKSSVGWCLLGLQNTDQQYFLCIQNPMREQCISSFLVKQKLCKTHGKIFLKIPVNYDCGSDFVFVLQEKNPICLQERGGMLKFNNSENLKPGIYRAHFNPDKTISTTLLYNNTDAVDLLNRIYKLSKPQSWKNNKIYFC